MEVYKAICKVSGDLGKVGINKVRDGAGYKFRGIDDVYQAINPFLYEHGLCILPRMVNRTCSERMSSNNKIIFVVTVEAEFDFVSCVDGSKHTVRTYGEAMDLSDKATNKAMSAAYKYACFQTFAIPLFGEPDSEKETIEVSNAINQNILADMLIHIDECQSHEELLKVSNDYYKQCKKDPEAQKKIIAAKDIVKRRLK